MERIKELEDRLIETTQSEIQKEKLACVWGGVGQQNTESVGKIPRV